MVKGAKVKFSEDRINFEELKEFYIAENYGSEEGLEEYLKTYKEAFEKVFTVQREYNKSKDCVDLEEFDEGMCKYQLELVN